MKRRVERQPGADDAPAAPAPRAPPAPPAALPPQAGYRLLDPELPPPSFSASAPRLRRPAMPLVEALAHVKARTRTFSSRGYSLCGWQLCRLCLL
jgi:hypothetical protein